MTRSKRIGLLTTPTGSGAIHRWCLLLFVATLALPLTKQIAEGQGVQASTSAASLMKPFGADQAWNFLLMSYNVLADGLVNPWLSQ